MSETTIPYNSNGVYVLSPAASGTGGSLLINNDKALSDAIDTKLSKSGGTLVAPVTHTITDTVSSSGGPLSHVPTSGTSAIMTFLNGSTPIEASSVNITGTSTAFSGDDYFVYVTFATVNVEEVPDGTSSITVAYTYTNVSAINLNGGSITDGDFSVYASGSLTYPNEQTLTDASTLYFPSGQKLADNGNVIYNGQGGVAVDGSGNIFLNSGYISPDGNGALFQSDFSGGFNLTDQHGRILNWNSGDTGLTISGQPLNDVALIIFHDGSQQTTAYTATTGVPNLAAVCAVGASFTGTLAITGTVLATTFSGSGANITNLNATNLASGTVANARTTAMATNTVSTIVLRDASGNFAANVITANGYNGVLATKTLAYTLTATDSTILVNSASNITMTLPTAVGITGREYTVKTIQSAATVGTTSSQTIDGSTTYSLTANHKYVSVISDGANWQIIANN